MVPSSDAAWPLGAPPRLVACHELLRDSLAYLTVPACRALAEKRLLSDGGSGFEAITATLDRARSLSGSHQDRAALAVCLSTLLEAEAFADGSAHLAQVAELWIPLVLSTPAAAAAWLAACEAGLTRSLEAGLTRSLEAGLTRSIEAASGKQVDSACDTAIWALELGLHAAGARSAPLPRYWMASGALSPSRMQLLLASQPAQQTVQRALTCAKASLQAAACLLQRGGSCSGERLDRFTELLGAALTAAQGESEVATSLAPWVGLCGLLQKVSGAAGRGARFSNWLVVTCRALSASGPDLALRMLSDCCREEGDKATLLAALSPMLRACLGDAASSLVRKRALYALSELWQPPSLAQAAFLELHDTLNESVLHLIKEQWAAAIGALHPPKMAQGAGPDPPAAGDRLPWCWSSLLWTRGLQHSNQQAQKSIALSFFGRSWTADALVEVPPAFVAGTLLPALTAPHMSRGEDGAALLAEAAAWVQLYADVGCRLAVEGAGRAKREPGALSAGHLALPLTLHLAFELLEALAVAEMPRKLSADLARALRVSGRALLRSRAAEVSGEGLRAAALQLLLEASLAQRGQGQNALVQAMLGDLLAGGLLLSGSLASASKSPLTPAQAVCLGQVLASQPLATIQSGGPLYETVSGAVSEGVVALPEADSWDEIFALCRALDEPGSREGSSAERGAAELPELAARPSAGGTVLARLTLVASLSKGGTGVGWLDRACAGGSDFAWTALGFVLQAATPVDTCPDAWDADQSLVAALAGLLEPRAEALRGAAEGAARELSRLGESEDVSSDRCGGRTLQNAVRTLQTANAAASFAAHPLCRGCVDREAWIAAVASPLASSLALCSAELHPVLQRACWSPTQQRVDLGRMLGLSACVGGQLRLALAFPAAAGDLSRPQVLAWALQAAEAGALPHSQRAARGESHWSARSVALTDSDRAGLAAWRVAADCLEALEQLDSERKAGCDDAASWRCQEADAAPRLLLASSSCLPTANEHDLVPLLRCLRWALPEALDGAAAAEARGEALAPSLARAARAAHAHPLVPASCGAVDALVVWTLECAWLAFSKVARRRSAVAGALVGACLQPRVLERCAVFGVGGGVGGMGAGEESQTPVDSLLQSSKPAAWTPLQHLSEDGIKKRLAKATSAFSPAHALVARLLRLGAKSSRIATLTALQLCGSLAALPHAAASFLPLLETLCLFGFADAPSCAEGALEAQPLDAETAGVLRHVPGLAEGSASSAWRAWECAPRVAAVSLLCSWARRAREGEEAAERACRALWARLLQLALTDPMLSSSKYQYHGDTHRIKVRLWQAVCALSPGVWEGDSAGTKALDQVLAALKTSEASSVKQYQETCALRLLGSPPAEPALRQHVLRELRELGSAKRDALPSLILVAAQTALESERAARDGEELKGSNAAACGSIPLSPLVSEVVHCLVPWTLVHVHATRTFAQLAVWRLLELFPGLAAESAALEAMGRFFAANADVRRLRSALGEGRDLDAFRLEEATSPEGILCLGAACAGRSEELAAFEGAPLALVECIQGFLSRERVVLRADLRCRLEQSLRNEYERGRGETPRQPLPASQPRQRKITPEDALAQVPLAEESAGAEMQRLLGSLTGRDESGGGEDWESELGAGNGRPKRQELIVVASLIDKIPNLAGLARTCEVMRATALVLSDAAVVKDPQFKSISVTAALWMPIQEVPEIELEPWLYKMASQGWSLVGLEQTSESISLPAFAFPEKTILVLGREKEGVPVNLLRLLHHAVEIPQLGVIRSLNVHVSGAIAAYEYTRQNLARQNL